MHMAISSRAPYHALRTMLSRPAPALPNGGYLSVLQVYEHKIVDFTCAMHHAVLL